VEDRKREGGGQRGGGVRGRGWLGLRGGTNWLYNPPPLKESHPEIGSGSLRGVLRRCVPAQCGFFCQGSLVDCSSNVIFFSTSEGSPSRYSFTTYSALVNYISLILRFKGQVGCFGLCTDSLGQKIGVMRAQKILSFPSSLFL
jgi:hypothetical protein